VTDIEHFDMFLPLQDAVYRTIDMSFGAVKQVPELVTLARHRTSIRELFQAENDFFQPPYTTSGLRANTRHQFAYKGGQDRAQRVK
jgi:hypothetical protein